MVTGALPFDGEDFKTLSAKVKSGRFSFPKNMSSGRPSINTAAMNLINGMLTVNPKKRFTIQYIVRHPWVNIGYSSYPIEHSEQAPTVLKDFVDVLMSVSVCQAGCMLMEELQNRIPSRRLAQDVITTDEQGNEILTDEDENNEELEANKFLSKMTIQDKPKKKIWWKRLWNTISRALIQKENGPTQNIRISFNDIIESENSASVAPIDRLLAQQGAEIKSRTRTMTCDNSKQVHPFPMKHKRTSWIPSIMRKRGH